MPSVVRRIHACGHVGRWEVLRHESRQVPHAMRVHGTGWEERFPCPVVSIANINPGLTLVPPITGIAEVHKGPQAGKDFAPVVDPRDRQALRLLGEIG